MRIKLKKSIKTKTIYKFKMEKETKISKSLFEKTRFALEILHGLKPTETIRIQRNSLYLLAVSENRISTIW